jgi:membrane protein YqaA with SNARE-associated domain
VEVFVDQGWLVLGTYLYCVAAGFIPVMQTDVYLMAVSTASPPAAVVPLIVAGTLGELSAKSAMYLAGRGVLSLPIGKHRERLDAASKKLQASKMGPGGFILLSGSAGLPPFYIVSILAGTLKIPFPVFFVPGMVGRLVRFGALVLFPQLGKGILA